MAKEKAIKDILPENTLKTRVPQEKVERVTRPAPSRYRNEIAKYIVHRSLDCERCGKCIEVCPCGFLEVTGNGRGDPTAT